LLRRFTPRHDNGCLPIPLGPILLNSAAATS
jgi:hypothetical protein